MKTHTNKIAGLHMIMAANQKGGASKSTTIAEIAAGLKDLGVPVMIVNLEVTKTNSSTANQRLRTMLRGSPVIDLDCSNTSKVLVQFGKILQQAKNKAVVLMDVPGALMTVGNQIWGQLQKTQYFNKLDSFTLVGTVSNELDHFGTAVHVTNEITHRNKHVFYRGWDNPSISLRLVEMAEWKAVAELYPSIVMPTRFDVCENVLFGRGEYTETPGLSKLREWYETEEDALEMHIQQPIELVLQSVDMMTDFLRTNYLPILGNPKLATNHANSKLKKEATPKKLIDVAKEVIANTSN